MTLYAAIGPKALYLLFIWLASASAASWLSDRKGYGERVGLMFGLLLTAVGLLVVLLLPARPGSKWKVEGAIRRRRAASPRADRVQALGRAQAARSYLRGRSVCRFAAKSR